MVTTLKVKVGILTLAEPRTVSVISAAPHGDDAPDRGGLDTLDRHEGWGWIRGAGFLVSRRGIVPWSRYTVRVPPGTYDVFAYVEPRGAHHDLGALAAIADGSAIVVASPEAPGSPGCAGQVAWVSLSLPTYGMLGQPCPLLASATLDDALERHEWDPADFGMRAGPTPGRMWRFTWRRDVRLEIDPGQPDGVVRTAHLARPS